MLNLIFTLYEEQVASGVLRVRYIPLIDQLVDIFIKGLSSQRHAFLHGNLFVVSPPHFRLKGVLGDVFKNWVVTNFDFDIDSIAFLIYI